MVFSNRKYAVFKATLADKLNIQIRLALLADAPAIASVLRDSFIEYQSAYTDDGFRATTPNDDEIRKRMTEGPAWVALHADTIVGTASAISKGGALYIRGMAVLPSARGQRIGELLLRQIQTFAVSQGFKGLLLSTTPFLTRAIQLYERSGFQKTDEGPHDLFGTPLFTMEKNLSNQ